MIVASRLGMSLQRCQQETTASEFYRWLKFFHEQDIEKEKLEWERVQKWEHYIARLIAVVKSYFCKGVREQDEIIKFTMSPMSAKTSEKTSEKPVTKEQRIKEAKSFWGAFFKVHSSVKDKVLHHHKDDR